MSAEFQIIRPSDDGKVRPIVRRDFTDSPFRCRFDGKRMVLELIDGPDALPREQHVCLSCGWTRESA